MPGATFRTAIAVLVPALLLFLLLLRPVFDTDIFWQLKLGELILAARHPLAIEPFAATHLGEPLPAVAWLRCVAILLLFMFVAHPGHPAGVFITRGLYARKSRHQKSSPGL